MQRIKRYQIRTIALLAALYFLCGSGVIPAGAAGARDIQTETQLRNAFFNGGQYRLTEHIRLTQTLHLSNSGEDGIFGVDNLELDLNGYQITCETTVLEIGAYGENGKGNLQITDSGEGGGLYCTGPAGAAIKLLSTDPYAYNLTIDAGTYQAQQAALWIGGSVPAARVQINRGVFHSSGGKTAPIEGNYSTNADVSLSPDRRTLTVGAADQSTTTSLPTPTETTQSPSLPHSTSSAQKQAAVLTADAAIPQASYILHIPASIAVPPLERCDLDAADKISLTPFAITISDMANFFEEKAVQLRLQSNFMLYEQSDRSHVLPFDIIKGGMTQTGDTVFATLHESQTQMEAEILIDRSLIRYSGLYEGSIEFEITLQERTE